MNTLLPLLATATAGEPPTLHEFYATNLRTGLFSGFLTLSGFLLAMKTLVVIQLRKELYDTKYYRTRVLKKRKDFPNQTFHFYASLRQFGQLLLAAVILALSTAVLQLTLGLWPAGWAAIVCVSMAGLTVVVLAISLTVLWANLHDLFAFWEEEADDKVKKEQQEAAGS